MSFDKAIIKRFNEESSCAPPPTKYDPQVRSSVNYLHFGQYSGRKEQHQLKDGFLTPAKHVRGRAVGLSSASTRSCSDTRLRKGSRSVSTKSLQEISPMDGNPITQQPNEDEDTDAVKLIADLASLKIKLQTEINYKKTMEAEWEHEKRSLITQNEKMTHQITEISVSCQDLEEQLEMEKSHYELMQKEHSEKMTNIELNLKNSIGVNELLQSDKVRLILEGAELKHELEVSMNRLHDLERQITSLNDEMKCLVREKEEIEASLNSLKCDYDKGLENATLFEIKKAKLEETILSLTNKVNDLTLTNVELKKSQFLFESIELELSVAKSDIEMYSNKCQSTKEELEEKCKQISRREHEVATMTLATQEELHAMENTIQSLQLAKEELKQQCTMLSTEIQKLKAKAEIDSSNIQCLNMELLNEREKLIKLTTHAEDEKLTLGSQVQEMEQRLTKVNLSYTAIANQLLAQTVEYQTFQQDSILKMELLDDDRKSHEEIIGILKTEKQRLHTESEELKMLLAEAHTLKIELQSNTADLEHHIRTLLTENKENGTKIHAIQNELKTLHGEMAELESNSEKNTNGLKKTIEGLHRDISIADSKNNELAYNKTTLTAELSAVRNECDQQVADIKFYKAELEEKEKRILLLERKIDSDKVHREEEIVDAEKIIADLQSTNGKLQQQNTLLSDEIQNVKIVAQQDASSVELLQFQMQQEQENTSAMKSDFEKEILNLTSKQMELENNTAIVSQSHQQLIEQYTTLEMQNEDLQQQNVNYKMQLSEQHLRSEQIMKDLTTEVLHLQSDKGSLKIELAKAESLRNELSSVNSDNALLKDQLQALEYQRENDKTTLESLNKNLQNYKERVQIMLKQTSEGEFHLAQIQQLKQENLALKENLDQYKSVYGDYANLASHQNNRQKIKHVVNIKTENINLRDENSKLRQKVGELNEKLRELQSLGRSASTRRFDPSQAFKPVLKEPFMRDDRDVRGPDARSTFTVPKKTSPKPIQFIDSAKKESKHGLSFDVVFSDNKEN